MRNFSMRIVVIALSFLAMCGGCVKKPADFASKKLSEVRGTISGLEVRESRIKRADYVQAVSNDFLLSRIRLVPLVGGQYSPSPFPEYRLFDIQPGSPYSLLGLQNADVIVGADDYIIDESIKFPQYMRIIQSQPGGAIEIRRFGKPILLKVLFVDDK